MNRYVSITLLLMSTTIAAPAATCFVATDGEPENDGSREKPWPSVEYALSKVGAGHTVILKPGIYRGPIQIPRQYAGTKDAPTVVKSEVKWKAIIVGARAGNRLLRTSTRKRSIGRSGRDAVYSRVGERRGAPAV